MMTLPGGVQMFVAEACSGMRQLTGFLALTTAVAYLSRPARLVSGRGGRPRPIPIAMTANVARVTLTGFIMYFVNPAVRLGGVPHARRALDDGLRALRCCWADAGSSTRSSPDRPPADASTRAAADAPPDGRDPARSPIG